MNYPTREQAQTILECGSHGCNECENAGAFEYCATDIDDPDKLGIVFIAFHDALDAKQVALDKANTIIASRGCEIDGLVDEFADCVEVLAKAKDLIMRMREWIDSTTIAHYSMGIGTVEQRTTTAQSLLFEAEAMTGREE